MQDTLKWIAPEFEHYQKNKMWFIVVGLIATALIIWALLSRNFLFALLIGLSFFSIIVYGLKKPRNIHLAITPKGVKVGKTLYEFSNLKSFWIFYDLPKLKEISIRSKKTFMPYIKLPLGEQNPINVRRMLIKYLPEKKQERSVIENLAKELRF